MSKTFTREIIRNGEKRTFKVIKAYMKDITEQVDLLLLSIDKGDYTKSVGSMLYNLAATGIDVEELAKKPVLDCRDLGFWVSEEINHKIAKRVGCVELLRYKDDVLEEEEISIFDFVGYVLMNDPKRYHFRSVGTSLLGTGFVGLEVEFVAAKMISLMLEAFKKNREFTEVTFYVLNDSDFNILERQLKELDEETFDVFISYSSKQRDIALSISEELKKHGLNPWIDVKLLQGGDEYLEKIPSAIQNSTMLLVVLTSDAIESSWVTKEINVAISSHKVVVPYKSDNCEVRGKMYFLLSDIEIIDSSKLSIEGLIKLINKKIKKE